MPDKVCPLCAGRGSVPEFKVCAYELCDKGNPGPAVFTWQDGRAGHNQRLKGVMYCTDACAKAAAQRRYRQRQKVLVIDGSEL